MHPEVKKLAWHSIDLGAEFIEGRRKGARQLAHETLMAHWPDMTGKSVLDIGAWGGWFSFEAERRGAAKVTAAEYYSWVMDVDRLNAWMESQRGLGAVVNAYEAPADCNDEDAMPGRLAFDMTRGLLGSKVRPLLARVEEAEFEAHDITLCLGVLYHNENPYLLLQKLASCTRELLILETVGVYLPGSPNVPAWHFFGAGELRGDGSTFWASTEQGLQNMLKRVGFSSVEVLYGAEQVTGSPGEAVHFRLWAHARK